MVAAAIVGSVVLAVPAQAQDAVWNVSRVGGPEPADGVLVAVVDSGVDAAHPAFAGRVVGQHDLVGDGETGDPQGHGTHVAGTAAGGAIDCGAGPATIGVAPTAYILSVRVLDARGRGTVGDVVDGIRYAADRGAAVINLSLGSDVTIVDGGSDDLLAAIDYAWSKGSIPVLAAGNAYLVGGIFGSGYGDIPAVVVTATTRDDRRASYATSVGSARWGIAAPGGDGGIVATANDILSAAPDSRCRLRAGTSMAAPHVSGALAVLRSRGLSPRRAVERMLATADDIGPESSYGAGLLNLRRALEQPPTASAPAPSAPPRSSDSAVEAPVTAPLPGAPTEGSPPPAGGSDPSETAGGEEPLAPGGSITTAPGLEAGDAQGGAKAQDRPRVVPGVSAGGGAEQRASGRIEGDGSVPAGAAVAAASALAAALVLAVRAARRLRQP